MSARADHKHAHTGCIKCFNPDAVNKRYGKTFHTLYQATMARLAEIERITRLAWERQQAVAATASQRPPPSVRYIWEHEWTELTRRDEHARRASQLPVIARMHIRDGLRGGRTGSVRILVDQHQLAAGQWLAYVDFYR